jgi:3-oxoacyl-[acyl-carrier-protein] synthase-3
MIARAGGSIPIGITGVGVHVPDRVLTNADLERMVETSDEWITDRTGIRERRIAEPGQEASDLALPAATAALEAAGASGDEIDYVVVATSTPDMIFPTTASLLADRLGARNAAAYDMLAACTGFVYGLAQAYGVVSSGLSRKALVVGSDVMSKIVDWSDRSTCILFGDAAGAVVVEPVGDGGFLGFELGADGSGGPDLCLPNGTIKMKGQEVYRFATRVMVTSAEELLAECGATVDDVDLYVPHQANKRIIDHAVRNLGIPPEKVVVNIDRYGNTSAASIPLCFAEALDDGSLRAGTRVLTTGVGGGLTWGSVYLVWSNGGRP